jgi:tRNA A37 threonylcarbamoyladenosine biosynthesis protein TsaE
LGLQDADEDMVRLIEWPEILRDPPADRLEIALSVEGEGRRARVSGFGRWRERMDGF